jgi:hypothetical protein
MREAEALREDLIVVTNHREYMIPCDVDVIIDSDIDIPSSVSL